VRREGDMLPNHEGTKDRIHSFWLGLYYALFILLLFLFMGVNSFIYIYIYK
jgi:hypothetical protein